MGTEPNVNHNRDANVTCSDVSQCYQRRFDGRGLPCIESHQRELPQARIRPRRALQRGAAHPVRAEAIPIVAVTVNSIVKWRGEISERKGEYSEFMSTSDLVLLMLGIYCLKYITAHVRYVRDCKVVHLCEYACSRSQYYALLISIFSNPIHLLRCPVRFFSSS